MKDDIEMGENKTTSYISLVLPKYRYNISELFSESTNSLSFLSERTAFELIVNLCTGLSQFLLSHPPS